MRRSALTVMLPTFGGQCEKRQNPHISKELWLSRRDGSPLDLSDARRCDPRIAGLSGGRKGGWQLTRFWIERRAGLVGLLGHA